MRQSGSRLRFPGRRLIVGLLLMGLLNLLLLPSAFANSAPSVSEEAATEERTPPAIDDPAESAPPATEPVTESSLESTVPTLTGQVVTNSVLEMMPSGAKQVQGDEILVAWNENLALPLPEPTDFTVMVNGQQRAVASVSTLNEYNPHFFKLILVAPVTSKDRVTLSYTQGTNPLKGAVSGSLAEEFTNMVLYNGTPDRESPQIKSLVANGASLTVCFDERLASRPLLAYETAFTVTYGVAATPIAVTSATVGVGCTGEGEVAGVRLTLASAVPYGLSVRLSYTNLQDGWQLADEAWVPNDVPSFTNMAVTNNTPASLTAATVDDTTLTLFAEDDLNEAEEAIPAPTVFQVTVAGIRVAVESLSISEKSVTLGLAARTVAGDAVTVTYRPPFNGIKLKTASDIDVAAIDNLAVTNGTAVGEDTTAPTLESAVMRKNILTLTFSEPMQIGGPMGPFGLTASLPGRTALVNSLVVSGNTVTATMTQSAAERESITLSYTPGSTGGYPLEDLAGNDLAAISGRTVVNDTDSTLPELLTALVNLDSLTLTYSEDLDPASVPAPGDFTVTVAGDPVTVDRVSLAGNALTLTLADAVPDKAAVALSYTKGEHPLQDEAANAAENLTNRTVNNITDTIAPVLIAAAMNGRSLILTYDDAPVDSSVPVSTDYTVIVDRNTVSVDEVSLNGQTLTLTLATSVTEGAVVTLSYTPGATPLRDQAGNQAVALVNQAVANGGELHVGTGQPFTTLESAMAIASEGSTIIVHAGSYALASTLVVTQPGLTIMASGTVAPTFEVQDDVGILIDAPNVTIQGLHLVDSWIGIELTERASGATVQGNLFDGDGGYAGIYVDEEFTGALTIHGNEIQGYGYGIYVSDVTDATVTITENKVANSGSTGIEIEWVENAIVTIAENKVANSDDTGIYVDGITNSTLTIAHNEVLNSNYSGIYIWTIGDDAFDQNQVRITGNTVGRSDEAWSPEYGIYLSRIDWDAHVVIEENDISDQSEAGLALEYLGRKARGDADQAEYVAPLVEVRNNTITNNDYGIYQYGNWTNGARVIISGNQVHGNGSGFYSDNTLNAYLAITGNEITENGSGITMAYEVGADGALTIDQNTIARNQSLGLALNMETATGAQVSVRQNRFAENGQKDGAPGLWVGPDAEGVVVAYNHFELGGGLGLFVGNPSGPENLHALLDAPAESDHRVAYNEFIGGGIGMVNLIAQRIDASLNWWGAASGPVVVLFDEIVGGQDEELLDGPASLVVGNVNVGPWLAGLTWSPASLSLTEGASQAVTATLETLTSDETAGSLPVDLRFVQLTSSAPGVATVAADGRVRAVAPGTARITTGLAFAPELVVTVTRRPDPGTGGGSPAPAAFVTISAAATETREATISVSGTANPGAVVSVGGTTVTAGAGGSWSAVVTLTEGANRITATNGSASQSVTVTRDSTPPVVTLTADATETTAESVTLSASTEAGATLTINGQNVGTGSGSLTVNLSLGSNSFTATAKDKLGNEGAATVTVVRKELPAPPVTKPVDPEPVTPEPPSEDPATPPAAQLTDVSGHWAQDAITRLVGLGIIRGYEDQTFRPEQQINRLEFTALLARALDLPGGADLSHSFTDAGAISDWARASLSAALVAGLVNGRADGSFGPMSPITRAEVAVMLANALRHNGIPITNVEFRLNDAAAVPDWAMASVEMVVSRGLLIGYEDGTFRPNGSATRAEVAAVLTRFLDAR